MKRKLIASFIAVTMLIANPTAALAAGNAEGALPEETYDAFGDEAVSEAAEASDITDEDQVKDESLDANMFGNIMWTYSKTGELSLNSKTGVTLEDWDRAMDGYDEYPWSSFSITKLSIGKGIYEIPGGAFSDCSTLSSVTMVDTVRYLDYGVFENCPKLTEVALPADYLNSEEGGGVGGVFTGCPLTTIKLSKKANAVVKNGVLYSGDLTRLLLYPAGLKSTEFQIPDSVSVISEYAFETNDTLKKIKIGKDCKVSYDSFYVFCSLDLEGYAVQAGSTGYSAPGGVLYANDKKVLVAWPSGKNATSYNTSSSCSEIRESAFRCASRLQEIGLTEGISRLGRRIFVHNESLRKLTIPVSVTSVNSETFGYFDKRVSWNNDKGTTEEVTNPVADASYLKDIYYTGTEEEWAQISGMADALAVYGDNKPEIHYNATPAAPSDEPDAVFEGSGSGNEDKPGSGESDEESGQDEPEEGFSTWTASTELKDGSSLGMNLSYKSNTEFDGRKHVVKTVGSKVSKESDSINPDIETGNFKVTLDGEEVPGVTIKSFSYKNNTNPGEMQLVPTFVYDNRNSSLKSLLNSHKDFKGAMNKLVRPTYKYDKEEEDYSWSNGTGPIIVTINQIDLTDVELYTTQDLKNDASLKTMDNILVWNGGKPKITYKSYSEGSGEDKETYWYATKVTIPGLYYQKKLPSGKIKKINLRAGSLSFSVKTFSEDGESWKEPQILPAKGSYDYTIDAESASVSEKGDYVQPILNSSGIVVTKSKKVTYKEDGETYVDYEDYEEVVAKPGYFTGTLPDFSGSGE